MPRTKRPVQKQEKFVDNDDAYNKKLEKIAQDLKNKIDSRAEMETRNVKLAFKIFLGSINKGDLHKTIGQLKTEVLLKEGPTQCSRSASHDDGYLTENSSQGSWERNKKKQGIPVPTSRSVRRRSRSVDTARKTPTTASKPSSRRRSRSVYRTPAYNKSAPTHYPPITPKVTPQTSLTILRQPRLGEMVFSMSGSPVLVSSCNTMQSDVMANCNIMLQDGTTLALQPKELKANEASNIPFDLMGNGVLHQLEAMKNILGHVVKLGKAKK